MQPITRSHSSDSSRSYYDSLAPGYDELHGEEQKAKARIVAGLLKPRKSDTVLDVACGTGIGSSELKCRLTGLDISPKMLALAPMPTVVGSAEKLPFMDKSFDHCICVSSIHNFRQPAKALDEIRRVSRGRCVISILKKSSRFKPILALIKKRFKVLEQVEEQHDLILLVAV